MNCLLYILRKYIDNTKNDWNYITPIDFYENYFFLKLYYGVIE